MSASRHELHGAVVEVDDALPGRPSGAILDPFPAPGAAAPAIRLRLRPAAAPRPLPAGAARFFHGVARAVEHGEATVLGDGASILAVSRDGRAIDGEIHASALDDPRLFAHTLLLMALLWALRAHGLFHLHAAALRDRSGAGLLVAANGGAGKSTVALALASAGHGFLGDDTVLVERRGAGARLLALPRPFHVAEATARAFPALAPHLGPPYAGTGKRFLDAEGAFGRSALRDAPAPSTILFPAIARGAAGSRLAPLSQAEALGRLIEASAFVAVDGAAGVRDQLGLLRELAVGARALRLDLGRDLLDDPAAWAAWLGSSL